MSLNSFDDAVRAAAKVRGEELAKEFGATVVSYYGPLVEPAPKVFRDFIEEERRLEERDRIAVVLNTGGRDGRGRRQDGADHLPSFLRGRLRGA